MVSLYRHYDEHGKLLYVGIASNVVNRTCEHEQASPWFDYVAYIKVEHYATRSGALIAESKAIKSENPVYNKSCMVRQPTKPITEEDVQKYPLVVAERDDIFKYFHKRWPIKWIADHFGTTVDIINFVLRNQYVKYPHGIISAPVEAWS